MGKKEEKRKELIAQLRKNILKIGYIPTVMEYNALKLKPSQVTLHQWGYKWREAVKLALSEKEFRQLKRTREKYLKEDCIDAIRRFHDENPHNFTQPEYIKSGMKPSINIIYHRWGNWGEAVEAAGLKSNKASNKVWTKEECLKAIRKFYDENPNNFKASVYRKKRISPSHETIRKLFGSWTNAVLEAGLKPYMRRRR